MIEADEDEDEDDGLLATVRIENRRERKQRWKIRAVMLVLLVLSN